MEIVMKLGIIGKSGAGKTTVFEALTQVKTAAGSRKEIRLGTVRVPDPRVDALSAMYQPRKTIYAQVEYLLPGAPEQAKEKSRGQSIWTQARDCDALVHVVRNFSIYGAQPPAPGSDFQEVDQELIINDLVAVEKRLERLELDQKRGKKADAEELNLLKQCHAHLNAEMPLRRFADVSQAPVLKGYAFLSAKPTLVLVNNEDEDEDLPDGLAWAAEEKCTLIRAKLEQELAQMTAAEAEIFLKEFSIQASATDRVIAASYDLLGLVSFFTVGDDEVRAWTIRRGTPAVDAAEVIHSDMKKGFIRAEVLAHDDLMAAGSFAQARKQGTVRLEGKTYEVRDGDIITFRFNV
jgi:GTP-binding protein YchF